MPPQATAPGRVRAGSLISSPITEASSSPISPKQITPKELRTKRGLAGILKSAAVMVVPKREQITTPRPIRTAGGDEGADGAEVVDPFADAEAKNVEESKQGQQCEGCDESRKVCYRPMPRGLGPSIKTETPTK